MKLNRFDLYPFAVLALLAWIFYTAIRAEGGLP